MLRMPQSCDDLIVAFDRHDMTQLRVPQSCDDMIVAIDRHDAPQLRVPQSCDDLIVAIDRHDTRQLRAWLDQFSAPNECYAALRALAESCREPRAGPNHSLAIWATNQMEQALALS